jgi:nicotinamidase-related amidase
MRRALILVDIQNDYFPGGRMELVGIESAARTAALLLQGFRTGQLPLFHVQHISTRPGATFFLPDTHGSAIHESVSPSTGEVVVVKHFPNSFRDTDLLPHLQAAGIQSLVICGAMSHMCIEATTRAAFDLGFACTVIEDACATRNLQFKGEGLPAATVHAASMAALSAPYATILPASEFVLKL